MLFSRRLSYGVPVDVVPLSIHCCGRCICAHRVGIYGQPRPPQGGDPATYGGFCSRIRKMCRMSCASSIFGGTRVRDVSACKEGRELPGLPSAHAKPAEGGSSRLCDQHAFNRGELPLLP